MRKGIVRGVLVAIAGAALSLPVLAAPAYASDALPRTSDSEISQVWFEYGDFASLLGCTNRGQQLVREELASDYMCVPSQNTSGWWTLLWTAM